MSEWTGGRFFGPKDYEAWLDRLAGELLGVSAQEFVRVYRAGGFSDRPSAHDLASVIPFLIEGTTGETPASQNEPT